MCTERFARHVATSQRRFLWTREGENTEKGGDSAVSSYGQGNTDNECLRSITSAVRINHRLAGALFGRRQKQLLLIMF